MNANWYSKQFDIMSMMCCFMFILYWVYCLIEKITPDINLLCLFLVASIVFSLARMCMWIGIIFKSKNISELPNNVWYQVESTCPLTRLVCLRDTENEKGFLDSILKNDSIPKGVWYHYEKDVILNGQFITGGIVRKMKDDRQTFRLDPMPYPSAIFGNTLMWN